MFGGYFFMVDFLFFFFFKQKTAYEMRISDWSSDVCSSDLDPHFPISAFSIVLVYPGADPQEIERQIVQPIEDAIHTLDDVKELISTADDSLGIVREIGRASCRARVCQYV